jgi:acetoin:2,6-dichlorophenolindophenol oxidoreductase subunit beta
MSEVTYKEAIRRGMADALADDERVFMLGEDIAAAGGAFKTTDGLSAEFGSERVLDTPISE